MAARPPAGEEPSSAGGLRSIRVPGGLPPSLPYLNLYCPLLVLSCLLPLRSLPLHRSPALSITHVHISVQKLAGEEDKDRDDCSQVG